MTKYLLAVHGPEEQYDTPLEDMQASFEATGRFNDKIMASGHWVFGGGLERPSSATVVDNTKGNERRHRRPVPRGQGADRRLLGHRGQGPRRGPGAGRRGVAGLRGHRRGASVPGRT